MRNGVNHEVFAVSSQVSVHGSSHMNQMFEILNGELISHKMFEILNDK